MYKLYGDGIHDDAPAIQEMLDSGISAVILPVPEKHYCIGSTLKIHSNQSFVLPENTRIRLLPNSNCFMLTNAEKDAHDISVSGGIWDYNNVEQAPNPIKLKTSFRESHNDGNPDTVVTYTELYRGSIMRFYGVTRFSIHDLTFKDPVTYCLEMAYVTYFTVNNIRFDQNLGNPTPENMDGIHVDGGCRFGSIRNVQGTCYDDIVALNADDGCDGPIEDIVIDGVYGDNSLRGVRLLSTKSLVARISISNVFGTFYQNCIGLTYFYPRTGRRGTMSHISVNNVFGENAERKPIYQKRGDYQFAYIWIDGDLDIDYLSIQNVYRKEKLGAIETIKVCKNCCIKSLALTNVVHQNETGRACPAITNEGTISKLMMRNVDSCTDELLNNIGVIHTLELD